MSAANLAYDRLCILTDLEPDDILAIYLLFDMVDRDTETLFIVGEGQVSKDAMCHGMCTAMGLTNFTILQGYTSSKDYPLQMLSLFEPTTATFAKASEETLSRFNFDRSLVLGLKPFSELLDFVDVDRFRTATFAFYGSFNLRCMLDRHTAERVADFVNYAFAQTFMYESYFATGEQNSASQANFPLLFDMLDKSVRLRSVLRAVEIWNVHIAKDCADTIAELAPQIQALLAQRLWAALGKSVERLVSQNAKVIGSIAQSESKQMVLADFALVGVLFGAGNDNDVASYRPVRFSFGAHNYSVVNDSEQSSRLHLIENVDTDALQRILVHTLN